MQGNFFSENPRSLPGKSVKTRYLLSDRVKVSAGWQLGAPKDVFRKICAFSARREFVTILTVNKTKERFMKPALSQKTLYLTRASAFAAAYVVLTYLSFLLGLDKGVVQFRLSEVLCVFPAISAAAVPGLSVGCLLANLLTGAHPLDILFGTLATLVGALGTRWLRLLAMRRGFGFMATIPPILANLVAVPLLLVFVYGAPDAYIWVLGSVALGEVAVCGVGGTVLLGIWHRRGKRTDKDV